MVIETSDGLRGVGEIPTLLDPAYKAEVDTPAVLTSLREFIVPSVARFQREQGPIDSIPSLRESYAWVKGAVFAKSGVEAAMWDIVAQRSRRATLAAVGRRAPHIPGRGQHRRQDRTHRCSTWPSRQSRSATDA